MAKNVGKWRYNCEKVKEKRGTKKTAAAPPAGDISPSSKEVCHEKKQ
jgi:hypothetical protein